MVNWPSHSNESKTKIYSEYCSHELNVFLKMKDPAYFESTVIPFIRNKIEKTFVDLWLLDNRVAMKSFLEPQSKNH